MAFRRRTTGPIVALTLAALYAVACSGSDSKKTVTDDGGPPGSDGGMHGDDAASGTGGTGGSAGTGGTGGSAGTGGSGGSPDASAGGMGPDASAGGADGGSRDAMAEGGPDAGSQGAGSWEFSVVPGSQGLASTGVAAQDSPESSVYVTNAGPSHMEGTNAQKISPADLGLLDGDDIDGLSYEHGFTLGEVLFSVEDLPSHDEGQPGSGVRQQSDIPEVPGDVFQTIGASGLSTCIPGPCINPNSIVIDDVFAGLQPQALGGTPQDNLNAIEQGVKAPPLYFTVKATAQGMSGTGVNGTAASERGCTIFKSMLDGTNSVQASCDDIGLVPGDEVDALYVSGLGIGGGYTFSVEPGATGKAGSEVNTLSTTPTPLGAHLFFSDGGGSNDLAHEPEELGLQQTDNLDAVSLFDGFPAKFERNDECVLPLETADCGAIALQACAPLGLHTLLCYGEDMGNPSSDYAFCQIDLDACEYRSGSYFTSMRSSYPALNAEAGGYFSPHTFVVTSAVDMMQVPSGPPQIVQIFTEIAGSGPGGEDAHFFRFDVASSTTGPYEQAFLDVPAPITSLGAVAPRPLSNGDFVALCLIDPGPTADVCRISVNWTNGSATITRIGPPEPPCSTGLLGAFIDQRDNGIDITSDTYACQHDDQMNLLEPARPWGVPDYSDPMPDHYMLEPGSLAVNVANDYSVPEVSIVSFNPAP